MLALDMFTGPRAAGLLTGRAAATQTCSAVFPPRPEDPNGDLVPQLLEQDANRRIAMMVQGTAGDPHQRQWWLEGLVIGFAEHTVESLTRAGEHTGTPVDTELRRMAASVTARCAEPARGDAVRVVFAVLDALTLQDPVALVWAVENLWRPNPRPTRDEVGDRVRSVASAAVGACCAAWRIELGVTGTP